MKLPATGSPPSCICRPRGALSPQTADSSAAVTRDHSGLGRAAFVLGQPASDSDLLHGDAVPLPPPPACCGRGWGEAQRKKPATSSPRTCKTPHLHPPRASSIFSTPSLWPGDLSPPSQGRLNTSPQTAWLSRALLGLPSPSPQLLAQTV